MSQSDKEKIIEKIATSSQRVIAQALMECGLSEKQLKALSNETFSTLAIDLRATTKLHAQQIERSYPEDKT